MAQADKQAPKLDFAVFDYELNFVVFGSRNEEVDIEGRLDQRNGFNFISQAAMKRLNFQDEDYHNEGERTSSDNQKTIELFFRWKGEQTSKTQDALFLVVEQMPYGIILGKSFLPDYKEYLCNKSLLILSLDVKSDDEKREEEERNKAAAEKQAADEAAEELEAEAEREKERQERSNTGGST